MRGLLRDGSLEVLQGSGLLGLEGKAVPVTHSVGNSDCLRGRLQAQVRERMGRYSWRFPARVFLLAGVGSRDGSTATRLVLILNTSVHLADLRRDSRLGHSKSSISPPTLT